MKIMLGDFLGELAPEFVEAVEARCQLGADAHQIVFGDALRAKDAALGVCST